MSTSHLLLEFFSEEIPAQLQGAACEQAKTALLSLLNDVKVTAENVVTACSSRRLSLCALGLPLTTAPQSTEKRGPRIHAAENAVAGFLATHGLEKADLIERDGYFYARLTQPGQPFVNLIPSLVESFIRVMPWPKTIRWALPDSDKKSWPWIRPVRSILCLWNGKAVPFTLPGWGLTAGNVTHGHRFLSRGALQINSFEQYTALLEKNFVVSDPAERRRRLETAVKEALAPLNLTLQNDESLWREVTGLVDWPFPVVGSIDPEFMTLPEAVLSTSMRVHQKYFSTRDANGKLAPFFVALSNVPDTPEHTVQKGFEKVLRARLSDAAFFYKEDLKRPLEEHLPQLDAIVFHEKLGSLGQKVKRLAVIAPDVERCARLCKLDLVSYMVGEFDELQGIMGAHYALQQGEAEEVARAIGEHYKPVGASDDIPESDLGAKLAILDRLDSLVGFLGVGISPSGSKDPYALRRAALGVLRISMKQPLLDFETLVATDVKAYADQGVALASDVSDRLAKFLYERLAAYWKEVCGFRYDIVQSVLTFGTAQERRFDFADLTRRVEAIQKFLSDSHHTDFMALFTRLKGLVKSQVQTSVNESLFEDASEADLCRTVHALIPPFKKALTEQDYTSAMTLLEGVKPRVDTLLDRVQINVSNDAVRENRLALLSALLELFRSLAIFDEIEVSPPR